MIPVLTEIGNASSVHRYGRNLASLIDDAREKVAALVGAHPSNTIFTASATEANNLALFGLLNKYSNKRSKILISSVEHPSIRNTAKWIAEKKLAKVKIIPVVKNGYVDTDALKLMVDNDTLLVSVMAANSETGSIKSD